MKKHGRILDFYTRDVHLNLALEESILRLHPNNHYFMTIRYWRNPSSVILGRSQDIHNEIAVEYCKSKDIEIARRISGGGTVFHDKGNLNISLFTPKDALEKPNDIIHVSQFFCNLFQESIQELGFRVRCKDGTNIIYKEKKISGAASYFTKEYVLYHATLLHSVNLKHLEKSLTPDSGKNQRASKYFPTININSLDILKWKEKITKKLEETFDIVLKNRKPDIEELELAKRLKNEIYIKQDWIIDGHRKRIKYSKIG